MSSPRTANTSFSGSRSLLDSAYGALVHNARTVIGFYHDGQLSIENQARPLSKALKDHADYVSTSTLTRLYKTKILPHSMQSSELDPPGEMAQPILVTDSAERPIRSMESAAASRPPPLNWGTTFATAPTPGEALSFRRSDGAIIRDDPARATPAQGRTRVTVRSRNRE